MINYLDKFYDRYSKLITMIIPLFSLLLGIIYQRFKLGNIFLRTFDYEQAVNDGIFISIALYSSFILFSITFVITGKLLNWYENSSPRKSNNKSISTNTSNIPFRVQFVGITLVLCGVFWKLWQVRYNSMYYYFEYENENYISYYSNKNYAYAYKIGDMDCNYFDMYHDKDIISRSIVDRYDNTSVPIMINLNEIESFSIIPIPCIEK